MTIGKFLLCIQQILLVFKYCGFVSALVIIAQKLKILRGLRMAKLKAFPNFRIRLDSSDLEVCKQVLFDEEYAYGTDQEIFVILDAGANIGCASVYFSRKFPNAKIVAVEPDQGNFDLLKLNTIDYPNIMPIKAAIWSENADLVVEDCGEGNWGIRAVERNWMNNSGRQCVTGMTVKTICDNLGLQWPQIVKIDIEGGEASLFDSVPDFIDQTKMLMIEPHDRWFPGTTRKIMEITRNFDFEWVSGENLCFSRESYKPINLENNQYCRINNKT